MPQRASRGDVTVQCPHRSRRNIHRAFIETTDRLVDLVQYLHSHLNESKDEIILRLGVDRVAQICGVVMAVGSEFAHVPDPALNLIQQLAPTLQEHTPYIVARLADRSFRDTDSCAKHVAPPWCLRPQGPMTAKLRTRTPLDDGLASARLPGT
jgi:hypothetical protein